jgi:hypothetical protein
MAKKTFDINSRRISLNPTRLREQLLDPTRLRQQLKYKINGLTVTSNDTNIMPRDEAGNVILYENAETNPLLIIEPVDTKIMLDSVLRVLNTRFEYFKFPVTTTAVEDEDIEIDITIPESENADIIYAHYKPFERTSYGQLSEYSSLDFSRVMEGLTQIYDDGYYISKQIKESGKDLRFRIKLTHSKPTAAQGTINFSIIKNSVNSGLIRDWRDGYASIGEINGQGLYTAVQLVINAAYNIFNISVPSTAAVLYPLILPIELAWKANTSLFKNSDGTIINAAANQQSSLTGEQLFSVGVALRFINDPTLVPATSKKDAQAKLFALQIAYDVYKTAVSAPPQNTWGLIQPGAVQNVYIDEVVLNSEFEIGDVFSIGCLTGQDGHVIEDVASYWAITDASKDVDEWNQENVND